MDTKKQLLKLLLLFNLLINTGCEENVKEHSIVGNWILSNFEEFKFMNCTDSLSTPTIFFDAL